jgi:hypothetical protein
MTQFCEALRFNLARTIATLIIAVSLIAVQASAQTGVTNSVSNGSEGDIDFACVTTGYCVQFFQVAQTSSGVTLSFEISTPDNQALVGIGIIPTSDLAVSPKQLVLNTDTSSDASLTGYTNLICDFSGNCSPATGGTLSFTWTQAGDVSFTSTGTSKSKVGPVTTIMTGTRSGHSAAVIGSFSLSGYSTSFAQGELFGEIISNRNVQLTISH